jgi:hypothetical protein
MTSDGATAGRSSDAARTSARGLLRRADAALEAANQDGLAAVGLGHAIEARVYAQAAKTVSSASGRPDSELLARALDIETAAQEAEDTFLDAIAE